VIHLVTLIAPCVRPLGRQRRGITLEDQLTPPASAPAWDDALEQPFPRPPRPPTVPRSLAETPRLEPAKLSPTLGVLAG